MSTTAIASPAALAPAAATARREGSSGVRGVIPASRGVARRTAVATALTHSRFLGGDASPAAFVSSATGSRARSRVVGARRVQTRALASPNELGDVAGTLGLTLAGFEQVIGKASFGALLGASSVYCYKVRVTTHPGNRITALECAGKAPPWAPAPPSPKCPNPYPASSSATKTQQSLV